MCIGILQDILFDALQPCAVNFFFQQFTWIFKLKSHFVFPIHLNKAKDIDAWISVYSKMSFLIHFILTLPTGRFFSAIYIYILTKMAFCIPHTNLSKTKDLDTCVLVFSRMSFLIHFFLNFLGCLIFSTIYIKIVERTSYPILKHANSRNFF